MQLESKREKKAKESKGAALQPNNSVWERCRCPRISEPRLVCKLIRKEAAGSDYHCDLGVHLPFDRKSVQMNSPPSLPPGRRSADNGPHKERTAVRDYLLIQAHGMKGRDTT